jgi:hypothetical protein
VVTAISMLYRKVVALAAGASASMLVLGSGIAHADESAYVKQLDVGGIPYDTPAGAVLMGQAVCTSLENGGGVPLFGGQACCRSILGVGGVTAGRSEGDRIGFR